MSKAISKETVGVETKDGIGELLRSPVFVRVSPNNYIIASFVSGFFASLFLYVSFTVLGAITGFISLIIIPALYFSDRIAFDGTGIVRTGIIPRLWGKINGSLMRLDLDEIEQIETQSLRALKRGGSVFYRYRTTVSSGETKFVIASGGERYRKMVREFLPRLSETLLDNRSIELRDYINEPKETQMKAKFAKVPSTDVLEESILELDKLKRTKNDRPEFGENEFAKADYLRTLANELRLSGYLLQALEVFRRALFLNPKDGWLLFEFARCLHSFAGSENDPRLERRALAVLRLAEKRAGNDHDLLERLGESYFQYGQWSRAEAVFKRVADRAEHSFRSFRGLAEIALKEGKIAHVIHHFATAQRVAELPSLRRWTEAEAQYFTKLNEDEDYLDMEVSRVNLLESLERSRKTTFRIVVAAIIALLLGWVIGIELAVNIGWSISAIAILIWCGLIISRNILSERIPVES